MERRQRLQYAAGDFIYRVLHIMREARCALSHRKKRLRKKTNNSGNGKNSSDPYDAGDARAYVFERGPLEWKTSFPFTSFSASEVCIIKHFGATAAGPIAIHYGIAIVERQPACHRLSRANSTSCPK